jgi:hypothetical protein
VAILQDVLRRRDGTSNTSLDTQALFERRRLATWIGMAGNASDAASRIRELAVLAARLRGEDDSITLGCRSRAAHWTAAAGEIQRGISELEKVLQRFEATRGVTSEEARACRDQLDYWRAAVLGKPSRSTPD